MLAVAGEECLFSFNLLACFIYDASCKLAYQLSQVTKTKLAIAEHEKEHLDKAITAFEKVGRKLGVVK